MTNRIFKLASEGPEKYRADLLALGSFLKESGQYDEVRSSFKSFHQKKGNRLYKKWKKQEINKAVKSAQLVGIITPYFIMWLLIKAVVISFLENLFFGDE